jgi:enoyl-[acyl-carrier-protein] reductase (NADH)
MNTNIADGIQDKMNMEGYQMMQQLTPGGFKLENMMVATEDVAALVLYLTSDQAMVVNGQIIAADKGMLSAA